MLYILLLSESSENAPTIAFTPHKHNNKMPGLSKPLLIAIKVSGILSICGSGFIIYDGVRNYKKRLSYVRHRVMFGLSICDVIFSFVSPFLGTWLLPSSVSNDSHFVAGTQATCNFQGFIDVLFGRGAVCYNSILAITHLLIVRYLILSCQNSKVFHQYHI